MTRTPIVVANHETTDPPNSVSEGEGRRRGRQCRNNGNSAPPEYPQTCSDTSGQPAKPTQASAAKEQSGHGRLARKFQGPQQFGADETANHTSHGRVHAVVAQSAPFQLPREDPDADEGANRHEHAKAGDLEFTEAE